jgi:hypothetical protein
MKHQWRLAALSLSFFTICDYGRLSPTSAFVILSSSITSRECPSLLSLQIVHGGIHRDPYSYLLNFPYPQQRSLFAAYDDYARPDDASYSINLPLSSSLPSWETELLGPFRNLSTREINPHKTAQIDTILQRLNSPAPQSFYVLQRAIHKAFINHKASLPSRKELQMVQTTAHFLIKSGYQLVIYKSDQHGSDDDNDAVADDDRDNFNLRWEIIPNHSLSFSTGNKTGRQILLPPQEIDGCRPNLPKAPKSSLQMANEILDIVSGASQLQAPINHDSTNTLENCITNNCLGPWAPTCAVAARRMQLLPWPWLE